MHSRQPLHILLVAGVNFKRKKKRKGENEARKIHKNNNKMAAPKTDFSKYKDPRYERKKRQRVR